MTRAELLRSYRRRIWVALFFVLGDATFAAWWLLSGRASQGEGIYILVLLTILVWVGAFLLIRINKHIRKLRT
jgi:hypothetical protein